MVTYYKVGPAPLQDQTNKEYKNISRKPRAKYFKCSDKAHQYYYELKKQSESCCWQAKIFSYMKGTK